MWVYSCLIMFVLPIYQLVSNFLVVVVKKMRMWGGWVAETE